MFYLIENNKIIKHSDKTQVEKYGDTNYLKYKNRNKLSFIKAQSDNVLDLIEVGDLIAFEYMDTGVIDIAKVVHIYKYKNGDIDISTIGYVHANEKIQAIYKPNANGDYIKVWDSK